jgi:hypothetical protein
MNTSRVKSGRLKYLSDRYADRVVLTFREIGDLLGFGLPEAAFQLEWWAGTTPPRSPQSEAWRLAHRTAVVNLQARNVVFDRDIAPDSHVGRK